MHRLGGLSLVAAAAAAATPSVFAASVCPPGSGAVTLPDKANFTFDGVHLNAALYPSGRNSHA
jgi:hypothetical protein